jgi:hypothetical protein
LVAVVLHLPEQEAELELLGSECNMDLTEDQVDALRTQTRQASKSLTTFIPPSVACGSHVFLFHSHVATELR